ncbi:MAG: hypothetical protein ACREQ5_18430 [Candidatus Dormibacteria bacterium]
MSWGTVRSTAWIGAVTHVDKLGNDLSQIDPEIVRRRKAAPLHREPLPICDQALDIFIDIMRHNRVTG